MKLTSMSREEIDAILTALFSDGFRLSDGSIYKVNLTFSPENTLVVQGRVTEEVATYPTLEASEVHVGGETLTVLDEICPYCKTGKLSLDSDGDKECDNCGQFLWKCSNYKPYNEA
jgi:hypothetical protein